MAIRSYVENGEKLYRVYINGFSPRGERFQKKKKGIKTLRTAETTEFEFKRELAKLREENVHVRWGEWFEECLTLMKIAYRPSTVYSYEKTVRKWIFYTVQCKRYKDDKNKKRYGGTGKLE